jgi:2-polyprenyl-3-methyl-5-hydroxy-6-metoxy-1,4-benzoquinol methylase
MSTHDCGIVCPGLPAEKREGRPSPGAFPRTHTAHHGRRNWTGGYALCVTSCCNPRGCDEFFTPRFARRSAKRYRKRGLDKTARRMVEFLYERGIEGASVLEIGGGIGEIEIELLKRGAARAVNLELSSAYEEEAAVLLREAGVEERAQRHIRDIAADPDGVEAADVVVLHRVVCCYPDYRQLLEAAAGHARRLVVFSYPPRNTVSRLAVAAQNATYRVLRKEYRAFVHPPSAMLGVLSDGGLRMTFEHHGLIWQVAGLER